MCSSRSLRAPIRHPQPVVHHPQDAYTTILMVVAAGGVRAWAVLLVNLAGALLLGVVVGWAKRSTRVARWSPLLGTRLAGALTSFSALAMDLAELGGDRPGLAVAYAAVSLLGGTLLAWVGLRRGQP